MTNVHALIGGPIASTNATPTEAHHEPSDTPAEAQRTADEYSVPPHTDEADLEHTFPAADSVVIFGCSHQISGSANVCSVLFKFSSSPVILPASGKRKRLVSRTRPKTSNCATPTPAPTAPRDSPNPNLVRRRNDMGAFQLFPADSTPVSHRSVANKENSSDVPPQIVRSYPNLVPI